MQTVGRPGARIALGTLSALTVILGAAQPAGADELDRWTVRDLTREGWKVTNRETRNETRPGLPPYEHLARVVSITTYTLTRDGDTTTCVITYDSQRDRLEEKCSRDNP